MLLIFLKCIVFIEDIQFAKQTLLQQAMLSLMIEGSRHYHYLIAVVTAHTQAQFNHATVGDIHLSFHQPLPSVTDVMIITLGLNGPLQLLI